MNASVAHEVSLSRVSSHSRAASSTRGLSVCSATKRQQQFELHVCTNKTCKKQGSRQVLMFARDLAIENLHVEEVGCLGQVPLRHMSTPAKVTDMLRRLCALDVPDSLLKATEKRLAGNAEARAGDLQRALQLYTEGIKEDPPSGLHMLYSNRAGARLASGDKAGAINDANIAEALSPKGFYTAYIRQVEAYAALRQYREAERALQAAARKDPSFRDTRECKSLSAQLSAYVQKAPRK